jgi:hypothetical protein
VAKLSNKKRALFWFGLLLIENVLLVAVLVGGVLAAAAVLSGKKSVYQRELEELGLETEDFRARAPYVMFRPRATRVETADMGFLLRPRGLRDVRGFCARLLAAGGSAAPSPPRRLWRLLPEAGRDLVREVAGGGPAGQDTQVELCAHVNRVLQRGDLYDRAAFRGLALCDDARALLDLPRERLFDYEVRRLNRHLLTAAFGDLLRRPSAINSRGFLSPELNARKAPDEYRLAMLGGSVVFTGPTMALALPAQLAAALREANLPALRDRRITYVNAGLPSGVSGQELAQLVYHVLPMNPDLLVVFDGFNDLFLPLQGYDCRPGYPYDYIVEEYRYYRFLGERSWSSTFLSLFDPALLAGRPRRVTQTYYQALKVRRPGRQRLMAQTLDAYLTNLRRIVRIARAYGMKVAVFLQPYSPRHNPADDPDSQDLRELYARAAEAFDDLAAGNGPDVIHHDMTYLGEELRELFVDPAHYRHQPGNRIVARRMVEIMAAEGLFAAPARAGGGPAAER